MNEIPKCPKCGGEYTYFDGSLYVCPDCGHEFHSAEEAVEAADVVVIVGTSLQVYPAASLYRFAKNDTPIYIIDPNEVAVRDSRLIHIKDVATRGMEIVLKSIVD